MPTWDTIVTFLFKQGGFAVVPLLFMSLIAVGIIIERTYLQNRVYGYKKKFFDPILELIRQGNFNQAWKLCQQRRHPLSRIIVIALENSKRSQECMESAVNLELQKVIPAIQKRLPFLQMIGGVATLLGLLGTIQGLIQSFQSLSSADNQKEALSMGISAAMDTTFYGLLVAIPCVIAFSILSTKQNAILQKYQEIINTVIHYIYFGDEVVAAAGSGLPQASTPAIAGQAPMQVPVQVPAPALAQAPMQVPAQVQAVPGIPVQAPVQPPAPTHAPVPTHVQAPLPVPVPVADETVLEVDTSEELNPAFGDFKP